MLDDEERYQIAHEAAYEAIQICESRNPPRTRSERVFTTLGEVTAGFLIGSALYCAGKKLIG